MIDPVNGAPRAEEESVTIGGMVYTMRCGTAAGYLISEMGLDTSAIFTVTDRERRVMSLAHVLKLFRATIAHNFTATHRPVPTPDEIALMLDSASEDLLKEITDKTLKVIYPKLWALTKEIKLREAAPAPTEHTN